MDLLGDLGAADQLTSARSEIRVLTQKVKELTTTVKRLTLENASLSAEVQLYREKEASNAATHLSSSSSPSTNTHTPHLPSDDFVRSGNGTYPDTAEITFSNPHGASNPLCCALGGNGGDTLLATGGADAHLSLVPWGGALAPRPDAAATTLAGASRVRFEAPVICTSFSPPPGAPGGRCFVGCGMMDGSVGLARCGEGNVLRRLTGTEGLKHGKYVRDVVWADERLFASSSADGKIRLVKVGDDVGDECVDVEVVETFHLEGAVESLCFLDGGRTLCCYERNTPYLSCFHLDDGMKQVKHLLNVDTTGGCEGHVSFAVLQLKPSPDGRYLAAATDTSRNIILQSNSSKQVRNLYGHQNDGYSQPKIAWSSNGQYLMGNTQDDSSVCVWDIASSSIVKRLDMNTCGGHDGQIRDIYSSAGSDTMVTVSYDKTAKVWLKGM
mmetsp:Transcript_14186/g.17861  ORF Transcript_14186/g.17861 Transcript_14186/m.17861 type:complete len:440 (-) Transcript_14186:80-1399(-)